MRIKTTINKSIHLGIKCTYKFIRAWTNPETTKQQNHWNETKRDKDVENYSNQQIKANRKQTGVKAGFNSLFWILTQAAC